VSGCVVLEGGLGWFVCVWCGGWGFRVWRWAPAESVRGGQRWGLGQGREGHSWWMRLKQGDDSLALDEKEKKSYVIVCENGVLR